MTVPASAWRRIAEEVQRPYPQDLQLEPHLVETCFTEHRDLPYPQEILDDIERTARTYGIERS